jgi:putative hydrolase of the HAD superfamily
MGVLRVSGMHTHVGDTYTADFAGPERFGMTAYLIDPQRRADVPEERRLDSVLDLAAKVWVRSREKREPRPNG